MQLQRINFLSCPACGSIITNHNSLKKSCISCDWTWYKTNFINIQDALEEHDIVTYQNIVKFLGEENFDKYIWGVGSEGLIFAMRTPNSHLWWRLTWVKDRTWRKILDSIELWLTDTIAMGLPIPLDIAYLALVKCFWPTNRKTRISWWRRGTHLKRVEKIWSELYFKIMKIYNDNQRIATWELDYEENEELINFLLDNPFPRDEQLFFLQRKENTKVDQIPKILEIQKKKEHKFPLLN